MIIPDVTTGVVCVAGGKVVYVKIQSLAYELNVLLKSHDANNRLATALPLAPDEKALCAGESCGLPVHWSRDASGAIGIVIGIDDMSWDFGVWMPGSTYDTIVRMIADMRSQL